jgi:hypothetical protein
VHGLLNLIDAEDNMESLPSGPSPTARTSPIMSPELFDFSGILVENGRVDRFAWSD